MINWKTTVIKSGQGETKSLCGKYLLEARVSQNGKLLNIALVSLEPYVSLPSEEFEKSQDKKISSVSRTYRNQKEVEVFVKQAIDSFIKNPLVDLRSL